VNPRTRRLRRQRRKLCRRRRGLMLAAARFLRRHMTAWVDVPPVSASFDPDAKIITTRLVLRHPMLIFRAVRL
jgi:hypothetical protein